ncbi:MAG: winged helix DNA-binding protein [Bacteroidota bacterium]
MTKNYQLLHQLLDHLEQYETDAQNKEISLMGFSGWLNRQLAYPTPVMISPPDQDELEEAKDSQAETALTILIGYLYRYSKHYTKKALEDTPLSTFDDFAFLATLSYQDSMTKTELIQQHILEITSGIEIIKRLTKHGLLEAFSDPKDRRSKRVRLTTAGKQMLADVMGKMDAVAHIVSGDLRIEDRAVLLSLLHKLNDFHAIIHMTDRKSPLEEIQEKYLRSPEVISY